jgi:hypothetical protein
LNQFSLGIEAAPPLDFLTCAPQKPQPFGRWYVVLRDTTTGEERANQSGSTGAGVRTVYGISASGKRRFEQLLNEQFAAEGPVAQTLYAPMLFLQFSNLPLIADLLRTRISREMQAIREMAEIRKQLGSTPATGALHFLKHLELQHRLDRKWLQGVLADVGGGGCGTWQTPSD